VSVPYALGLAARLRHRADRPMTYHHATPNRQHCALDDALQPGPEESVETPFARHAAAAVDAVLPTGAR